MNAAVPREQKGGTNLMFAIDTRDGTKYLIDSGAVYSIVPPTEQQRSAGPNAWRLEAANGSEIPCFGLTEREIFLGDRPFPFTFIVADVQQSIIGADFLSHFYLAPNLRDKSLIDLNDFSTISLRIDRSTHSEHFNRNQNCNRSAHINRIDLADQKSDPFYQLIDSYPELSTPSFKPKEVSHGVKHHIPTNCRPIQSKVRPLNPEKLAIAKQEFEKLVELGICYRGKSE